MKPLPIWVAFLASGLPVLTAHAQFPNFPAADRVLGRADFTTPPLAEPITPTILDIPNGVAVDPLTGKLFVSTFYQHRILRYSNSATLENGLDGSDAEWVIGQAGALGISPGPPTTSFNGPASPHVDHLGRLWVADSGYHRVLMFLDASSRSAAFATDLVLGQPDLVTTTPGTSATKMSEPSGVFVDAADNLWVADYANHRVLKFANVSSLANGAAATSVLGQVDFDTRLRGTDASTMAEPAHVAVDGAGRLWVADFGNSRVLRYDGAATLANGSAATAVLGQPDFVTSSFGTTAGKMESPFSVLVDRYGTLYVSDKGNHRILVFRKGASKANGADADRVIGQPDFQSGTGGMTERYLDGPAGMVLDLAGKLWLADSANDRVLRFSPDWTAAKAKVTGSVPDTTSRAALRIRGTAADPNGVVQIRYRVGGQGGFRAATGTKTWRFTARLKRGANTIEIVAEDGAGNTSPPKRLRVTRL